MRRFLFECLFWLPVGVIPIVNGIVRFTTYQPLLGEPASGLISSGLDILLIVGYAFWLARKRPAWGALSPLRRGLLWLVLSTATHFLLGHYLFGISFGELAGKYDILRGETWPVISLVILLAPWIAARRARGP